MHFTTYTLRDRRILFLGLIYLCCSISSWSQITGTILDSKNGKPLEGVEVFINQSTVNFITDKQGFFQLTENIPQGYVDIILFKKGYRLFQSSLRTEPGRMYKLNLAMERATKRTALLWKLVF
ncbi:MAG: carboxypeptidase-like regulatory domain-containing protein [Cyclobacteriaceae bacterium]|jgi:hypothetical protein